jgi:hypothetical protein
MKDEWQAEIEQLVQPMDKLSPVVWDTTYLLKKTGAFTYTEGYFNPPGQFYGKIINYPDPHGEILIHKRPYTSITKAYVDGKQVLIPHDRQIERHYVIDPTLKPPAEKPVITEFHVLFDLEDFDGWFSDKLSLARVSDKYPQIGKNIEEVSKLLSVPMERLGVTGSLSYGRMEDDEDIDLVFFGSPEENMEVAEKIWGMTYSDPARKCIEFGKFWPIRFMHNGIIICTFFAYEKLEHIPLTYCDVELLTPRVEAYGTIRDNTHSIYMPLILDLKDVYIDGKEADDIPLVIYDGSIRGEFYTGERLKIEARLVSLEISGKRTRALISVDSSQIEKERFQKGRPLF